jgi:signal transduction histidine kinase
MITERLDSDRLRTLIEVGGSIVSDLDLDLDSVLGRVLDAARELTGARYAAVGVLDAQRDGFAQFLTRGVDAETEEATGDQPRGRGVLGVLIRDAKPLRLSHVGEHPESYGFPAGHPPMASFLGVPVLIRGEVWGILFLTEKADGEFDETDEEAIVVLARWAAIAAENARLSQDCQHHLGRLQRAVRGLEATQAIALAVGADIQVDRVLELIAKRGRALVEARSIVILLREDDELRVAASAGEHRRNRDVRIPVRGTTSGEVMERGTPERISDLPARLQVAAERLGVEHAKTALIAPLTYRGTTLGVLLAFDHGQDATAFSVDDEHVLRAFAASAATAVAIAQTVERDRLRDTLASADAERRHWAQELHDETLQTLAATRMQLGAARRTENHESLVTAADTAIEQLDDEIANLRAIITELRPPALDELGLGPALEALFERRRTLSDLDVSSELTFREKQLGSELPTTLYRVVQEALTNVAKHARATTVKVTLRVKNGSIVLEVSDDGCGFDADDGHHGFGIIGMRERVLIRDGHLTIDSSDSGTAVTATLPLPKQVNAAP